MSANDTVVRMDRVRNVRDANENQLDTKLDHAPIGKPTRRLSDPLPEAQPPEQFVKELTNHIVKSAAANVGPFYEELLAGRIPIEGLREWIKQWYFDSRTFPSVIAQIAASATYYYDARQFMGAKKDPNWKKFWTAAAQ
ncbi:hypothetical protein [Cystobacter fuscus]|uniref:hypothetical protein n=1 Tax=Cystobacter fuscus TaxID=43 RepID=UPI002B295B75|nr:hypothetical protein F0U63_01880 [Cystobacter fuscus]